MTARVRKAIGSAVILVFMVVYIAVASGVGNHIPNQWFLRFAYFLVAGTAWGVPLIPLMIWMNKGR
jgi:hypothetical protein